MTIQEIKAKLSMGEVLNHYGHQPNHNPMLHCPFHQDKTASMQVYPATNTVFSVPARTAKALEEVANKNLPDPAAAETTEALENALNTLAHHYQGSQYGYTQGMLWKAVACVTILSCC